MSSQITLPLQKITHRLEPDHTSLAKQIATGIEIYSEKHNYMDSSSSTSGYDAIISKQPD